jgi:hypothetical protein
LVVVLSASVSPYTVAEAASTCTFTTQHLRMMLDADCTTDESIIIPDGFILDGNGHTISAVDPPSGGFTSGVIKNGGAVAHVRNVVVTSAGLAVACHPSAPVDLRLRGILFDGAAGSIKGATVTNVRQLASGCQEGNAIEVRNAPFDETHPNTLKVTIEENLVDKYMKGGIICNGDLDCRIRRNFVGSSGNQQELAANAVQIAFGAKGTVRDNFINGNQWLGPSDFVATAILAFCPDGATIRDNVIAGNSDVGIYAIGGTACQPGNKGVKATRNKILDVGVDGPHGDWGVFDEGTGNRIADNTVIGFDTPTDADPADDEIKRTQTTLDDDDDDDHDGGHRGH